MFKNEKQLRKLMRDCSCKTLWWIEPNLGSSDGLPDCFTLVDPRGELVFAELKRGWLRNGVLRFEVRPSQRETLPELISAGATGVVIVAEIGSRTIHSFSLEEVPESLAGNLELDRIRARFPKIACSEIIKGSIMGHGIRWKCYGNKSRSGLKRLGIDGPWVEMN